MPKYRVEIKVEANDLDSIPDALNQISIIDLEHLKKVVSIYNEDTNLLEDFLKIF